MAFRRIILRSKLVPPFFGIMFGVVAIIWSLYVQFGDYQGRLQSLAPLVIVLSAIFMMLSASNFSHFGKIVTFGDDIIIFGIFNSTLINLEEVEKVVFIKKGSRIKKIDIITNLNEYTVHCYDLNRSNLLYDIANQYNWSIEKCKDRIVLTNQIP